MHVIGYKLQLININDQLIISRMYKWISNEVNTIQYKLLYNQYVQKAVKKH